MDGREGTEKNMGNLLEELNKKFEQGMRRLQSTDSVFDWALEQWKAGDVVVKKLLDTLIFGQKHHFDETMDELYLRRALDVDRSDPFHVWVYSNYQAQKREVFLFVKLWWCHLKSQNLIGQGAAVLRLRELWELSNLEKLL
jgi:hypothetical protein